MELVSEEYLDSLDNKISNLESQNLALRDECERLRNALQLAYDNLSNQEVWMNTEEWETIREALESPSINKTK